ncbi:MAG: heme ABC transporter ATP-binding protein [Parcubacteria group bacterium Gr01-1014_8]|nr:MAG: heme ABC transporter ATP-binding protein [Parcubacteria group bacterium Gr01-1014_8]
MSVLNVQNLTKVYKDVIAVDGISFSVSKGEIVGLLGPNGAGKTSTISMILGVLEPSGGNVFIDGKDIVKKRSEALVRTNFAAVYAQLPGNLSVYQNLMFFGLLYDVHGIRARIETMLEKFDLKHYKNSKVGFLSSGEQTRVGLAKAMLNSPGLLLLDEPTASLDPSTARTTRESIKEYAAEGKGGVVWTSHNMQEVEAVCDRVLFLSHGKILLEGNPKTLAAQHGKKDLEELFITVAREPLSLDI